MKHYWTRVPEIFEKEVGGLIRDAIQAASLIQKTCVRLFVGVASTVQRKKTTNITKQEDRKYQLALYWSFTPSTCEKRCKWSVIVEECPMSLSVAKVAA